MNPSSRSYRDTTCYGWGYSGAVVIGGMFERGKDGWMEFQQGDRVSFEFNPITRVLSMKLDRLSKTFSLHTNLATAYIFCSMYEVGTKIAISPS